MSSTRPVTKRSPSASNQPMSPVKYQPPVERLRVGVGAAPVARERLVGFERGDDLAFLVRRHDGVRVLGSNPHHPDALVDAGLPGRTGLAGAFGQTVNV